jgi:hypothetical protein
LENNTEVIRLRIKLADTVEDADKIISEQCSSYKEKNAFLDDLFGYTIVARHDGNIDEAETDYKAVLSAIVNQKWRV